MRFCALVLLSTLCAAPLQAQPLEHAANPILVRLGETINLEEKTYFGFFTSVRADQFTGATLHLLPHDRLRMEVTTRDGTEAVELDSGQTLALAQYVAHYEALRFNPVPAELVAAQQVLAADRIARPTLAFADTRRVSVRLRDGRREQGWVLYADEQYLVLYKADAPFDAASFQSNTVAIPGSSIEHVSLPGLPSFALRAAEVGGVTALQAGLAYATYESRSSGTLYGANATAGPLTALGLYLFGQSRLQSPYRVEGNRTSYLSLLRRLRPRVFFARTPAPELRAWLAEQPAVAPEQFSRHVQPLRHAVHVLISAPFSLQPEGTFTRNATARINGRNSSVTQQGEADVRNAAISAEIAVSPLRWLHVGGEAHRYQSLPIRQVSEQITRRQGWGAFAGITLGDGTARTAMSKVSFSGGLAQRTARLDGFLFSTLAMQSTPTNDPTTYQRYTQKASGHYPYARLVYDFFATSHTSLSLKVTYVQEASIEVAEKAMETRFGGNQWNVVQPAHTYRFNPVSVSLGLRTHF